MNRKIATALVTSILLFSAGALAPSGTPPSIASLGASATAGAAVTKSLSAAGGGGGNVGSAGNRLGGLLSGWAVPVITVLAGCLLVGALASRNIGASVGIVVITLLGLIFLLAPQTVESFAKGIASTVF
ncbi:MAG TPA: hypothetical protein VNY83_05830 [Solirubrobacterales bacterium]|jgi:hypothetical protein|nr:hypothetical protein [Solirubrobacterales bacterium]